MEAKSVLTGKRPSPDRVFFVPIKNPGLCEKTTGFAEYGARAIRQEPESTSL